MGKEDWELDNSDPFEAAVGLLIEKNDSANIEEASVETDENLTEAAHEDDQEEPEGNLPGQIENENDEGENMEEDMANADEEPNEETPVQDVPDDTEEIVDDM